jgi:ferric-dicitrate binding protein FerR (iron transport regulator)
MLGSPDASTTGRMRSRLDEFMHRRALARRRRLRLGLVIAAVVFAIAAGLAIGLRDPVPHAISADSERAIELGGARVLLRAGASVRTVADDETRIELVGGEIEVTVATGRPFVVHSGEFEVHAQSGRFSVRHTDGLPVVTALRDDVVLHGPGLPTSGVRVLAR